MMELGDGDGVTTGTLTPSKSSKCTTPEFKAEKPYELKYIELCGQVKLYLSFKVNLHCNFFLIYLFHKTLEVREVKLYRNHRRQKEGVVRGVSPQALKFVIYTHKIKK